MVNILPFFLCYMRVLLVDFMHTRLNYYCSQYRRFGSEVMWCFWWLWNNFSLAQKDCLKLYPEWFLVLVSNTGIAAVLYHICITTGRICWLLTTLWCSSFFTLPLNFFLWLNSFKLWYSWSTRVEWKHENENTSKYFHSHYIVYCTQQKVSIWYKYFSLIKN